LRVARGPGGAQRKLIGFEVVELNERHRRAGRAHDDVALLGGRTVEQPLALSGIFEQGNFGDRMLARCRQRWRWTVKEGGLSWQHGRPFLLHQEKSTMQHVAEITLVENSTAGNQPKIFAAQTVEIRHEADTVITGLDNHTSRGRHPSKVFWLGGTAKDLMNITDVKIVGNNGGVLVDGELNATYDGPRDIVGGVEFFVLKPD
jgi:hypothetical protein